MGRLESPSRGVAICFIVATTIPPSPSSPKKLSSADARSRPAGGKLPQVDAPAAPRPSVRASRRQPDPGRHGHSTATDCAEEQNDALIGPSREGRRKSGLQGTHRWRKKDSNPRSLMRGRGCGSRPTLAMRRPGMRVVVLGIMLAQQVLTVIVAVRAHHGVDVIA